MITRCYQSFGHSHGRGKTQSEWLFRNGLREKSSAEQAGFRGRRSRSHGLAWRSSVV